jgi:hypothetical protein
LLLQSTIRWSPQELDATDALLHSLLLKFRHAKRG